MVSLTEALLYIVENILKLFLIAFLLRFYLQLMRASFSNPISQFVVALTDFLVRPIRKIIPGRYGYDWATLALAWFTAFLLVPILFRIFSFSAFDILIFALLAIVELVRYFIYILIGSILILALLSLLNPHSPYYPLVDSLTRPFLRPIQRRLPMVGPIDLSPWVLLIVCQLILMLPVAWLEALLLNMRISM